MRFLESISTVVKTILTAAVAALVLLIAIKLTDCSEVSFFSSSNRQISCTALVVEQIKAIEQLTTASYHEELVIQDSKYRAVERPVLSHIETGNRIADILASGEYTCTFEQDSVKDASIALIISGTVRAGLDLSSIAETDISFNGDTLCLKMPVSQILDVIINPSSVEIFDRYGRWSDTEISALIGDASSTLSQHALAHDILAEAEKNAINQLTSFFNALGFNHIVLSFENTPSETLLPKPD